VTNLQSTVAGYGYLTNVSAAAIVAAGAITNAINTTNAAGIASVADGVISIGTATVAVASSTPEWTLLSSYTNAAYLNTVTVSNLTGYSRYRFMMSGVYSNQAVNYVPFLTVNGIAAGSLYDVYHFGGWANGYYERRAPNQNNWQFGNWVVNGGTLSWWSDFVINQKRGFPILFFGNGYMNSMSTQILSGGLRTNVTVSTVTFTHMTTGSANTESATNRIDVYGSNL
jgi:hypothetical protein